MKDDPSRKDITNRLTFSAHIPNIDDLRSHKTRCATSHKQVFLLISISSQSEITDSSFPRFLLFEHDVLWL